MRDIGSDFRALHRPGAPFLLANVWDAGSARVMAALGATALGTSSAAQAFTLGRPDGGAVSRDEALAHAEDIVAATGLPVSGDFQNGYADDPDGVAETVRLAAEVGLAGISIEDIGWPEDAPDGMAYDREAATERVRAAAAAARALPRDFVLVARADGVMTGAYGMDEALARVAAFDAAGADCLYVPLPPSLEALAEVVRATEKPVNALAAGPYARLVLSEFGAIGVARVSVGSALARVTHAALVEAGRALMEGRLNALTGAAPGRDIDALLDAGARRGAADERTA